MTTSAVTPFPRPFTDADYAGLAELINTAFPEYPETEAALRTQDGLRDPKCRHGEWVMEANGVMAAFGDWSNTAFSFHPRKFRINLFVHPDYREQGVGTALFDQLLRDLKPLDPLTLRASVREDWPASLAFAAKRGFVEEMRHWESHLDVTTFDASRLGEAAGKAAAHGISVFSHPELAHNENHLRRLYEMTEAVSRDVPSPDVPTGIEYEQWLKYFEMPGFLPDGTFVAVDANGEYVGFSNLFASDAEPTHLNTGLTGVRRENRRQGVALALKLRAVEYAKARGTTTIRTSNETNNVGMLSINEALGFVKQPAWLNLVCRVKEEDAPLASEEAKESA